MELEDMRKQCGAVTTPLPIAASSPPPSPAITPATAAAAVGSANFARPTFLILAALMSASFFIEPFVAAAADLRLTWPAGVAVFVIFALFCALVDLFRSFFLLRSAPAAAAVAMPPEGVGAFGVAIASVGIGVASCLIAASGSAYGYAPSRS